MPELDPDVPDRPIVVPSSPAREQLGAGGRDLLLIVAALPALLTILGRGNFMDVVRWFASEPGLGFVSAVVVVGTPLWRQWLTRRRHADAKLMARNTDDAIAVVK